MFYILYKFIMDMPKLVLFEGSPKESFNTDQKSSPVSFADNIKTK